MKLDENLALVIPLYRDDTVYAYVHSAPISRRVFEMNYKLLTDTFSGILARGMIGSRVSHLILKDAAIEIAGDRRSPESVSAPVLNEIKRLTNVFLEEGGAYASMPLDDALNQKKLDEEDISEVMAAVVFFTASWHMAPRAGKRDLIDGGARLWGAQTSSLDATAFGASLGKSTETASSGVNPKPASSVPF